MNKIEIKSKRLTPEKKRRKIDFSVSNAEFINTINDFTEKFRIVIRKTKEMMQKTENTIAEESVISMQKMLHEQKNVAEQCGKYIEDFKSTALKQEKANSAVYDECGVFFLNMISRNLLSILIEIKDVDTKILNKKGEKDLLIIEQQTIIIKENIDEIKQKIQLKHLSCRENCIFKETQNMLARKNSIESRFPLIVKLLEEINSIITEAEYLRDYTKDDYTTKTDRILLRMTYSRDNLETIIKKSNKLKELYCSNSTSEDSASETVSFLDIIKRKSLV